MTGMQRLFLRNTQVADLSPIVDMAELRDLEFRGIPACAADPELERLSEIATTKSGHAKRWPICGRSGTRRAGRRRLR